LIPWRSLRSIGRVENVARREVEIRELVPEVSPVAEILKSFAESWVEVNPLITDEDAYIGDTQNVPAGTEVTVTYNLMEDYNYYIKRVYVDAAAGLSYTWKFTRLVGYGYLYERTLRGNEHEFTKRLIARRGSQIILVVTNPTSYDYDLDITVDMWARKVI